MIGAMLARLASTTPPTGLLRIAYQSACNIVAKSLGKQIYDVTQEIPMDLDKLKTLQLRRLEMLDNATKI
jgi:hypothetical protein